MRHIYQILTVLSLLLLGFVLPPSGIARERGSGGTGGVYEGVSLGPCVTGNGVDRFGTICSTDPSSVPNIIANVFFGILIIATVLALFFLLWGGFKWITSGGDKAKIDAARQTLIAAIIGLILTFLAFFVISLVLGFFGLSFDNFQLPKLPK